MRKSQKKETPFLFSTGTSVLSLESSVSQYTALKRNCISWVGLPIPNCAHDLLNDLENLLCAIVHPDTSTDNDDCI